MSWLIGQVWLWMLLSAVLGAGLTTLFSLKRVAVERWVEVEAEVADGDLLEEVPASPAEGSTAAATAGEPQSPFPTLPGLDPSVRPWEEEEMWSRPARVVASAGAKSEESDEWSEAASNWRTWADAAAGRSMTDEESGTPMGRGAHTDPFPAFPVAEGPASPPVADEPVFPHAAPVDAPFPHAQPVDPFPYAQPVDVFPKAAPVEAPPVVVAAKRFEAEPANDDHADDDDASWRSGPYGPGSAYAPYDGSAPAGHPVKGTEATKLFHPPGSRFYSRTPGDVWFRDEATAEAAGFIRWDRRVTAAHVTVDANRSGDGSATDAD